MATAKAAAPRVSVTWSKRRASRLANPRARGRDPNLRGLPGPFTVVHRDLIISLATRHALPNVHAYRYYPAAGGRASYGVDNVESYRRAASYVDRILKGEKPADLPVQLPTTFNLVINLKSAGRSASTCRPHCSPAPTR